MLWCWNQINFSKEIVRNKLFYKFTLKIPVLTTILKIDNLSKNYGSLKALSNLSLEVKQGMVYGILGPNGSGKTTTLGILLGVLNPSAGHFSWFNNGMADANRKRIGALLETPNFYPYLNAIQNLRVVGKIKRVNQLDERIETVLKAVNLYERRESYFRTFSLGMKQRLAIASALLSDPEVLVLDEPTNGLDPQGIAEIRALIISIAKEGKTIIIASHQLDEIEKVCSDVLILRKGVALRSSAIDQLAENKQQIAVSSADLKALQQVLEQLEGVHIEKVTINEILLEAGSSHTAADINRYCFENGIVLNGIKVIKKSLEDQFLEIVKK